MIKTVTSKNKGKTEEEAILINNLGYEYILEQKWKEAEPLFKEAMEIFNNLRNKGEYNNAKTNYITCKIERDQIGDIETMKQELMSLAEELNSTGNYRYRRKPYIMLAKLEEKKGNIEGAIVFVEKALSIPKDVDTTYPEEDRKHLDNLRKKLSVGY